MQSPPIYQTQLPPAQLWIGQHEKLITEIYTYLKALLCTHKGCLTCLICKQIQEQQHYAVTWLAPHTNYTLDQITEVQKNMSFVLEDQEYHFFIFQKSEALTPLCSNRLLKSIEEPPAGYHFIFLAQQKEALLKTIQSRCVLRLFQNDQSITHTHPLYSYFITPDPNPTHFEKDLTDTTPNERESLELAQTLLHYWTTAYTHQIRRFGANQQAQSHVKLFSNALRTPAMPGSSKIFWKHLFLQYISYTQ